MTLVEQLRAYIAPDDNMEDHDDIRALMHAGADRLAQLESALKGTLSAMEMQIGREAGELHIHSAAAWKIWSDAVTAARACFPVETGAKHE
jgi:hypothetical protein